MRAIVVGGGIFGQVVAWRLARRGVDVVLLEAVTPAHAASQSGDRSRVVRALYGEKSFATSGFESLKLWKAWSKELGVELVELSGVLYLDGAGATEDERAFQRFIDQGIVHLAGLGARLEVLSAARVAELYPAISPEGVTRAVLEPGGGFGRAALATETIAKAAAGTGKVRLERAEAKSLEVEAGAVRAVVAETANGAERFEGDVVVVAAGLGGPALIEPLVGGSLSVRPVPHFVTYWELDAASAEEHRLGRLPVWAELGAPLYGFPDEGGAGFKVAWHAPLRPDDERAEPTDVNVEALRRDAARRFPALARAKLKRAWRCTYDSTPDENFQIGWVPGLERLYLVGGLSGHGFKHAPAIGESVAGAIAGEAPLLDLSPYAVRLSAS